MADTIDRFIPIADVRERFEVTVRAPADLVFDVAESFDLQSLPPIRLVFWLRSKLMRGAGAPSRLSLKDLTRLGWGILARTPGKELIGGGSTRPWLPNPVFRAIPPDEFLAFDEPGVVKIVWSFDVKPLGPERCRLRTQTRVEATDDDARRKFRRYWLKASPGILMIRWLALPAMKRQAERQWRAARAPLRAPLHRR